MQRNGPNDDVVSSAVLLLFFAFGRANEMAGRRDANILIVVIDQSRLLLFSPRDGFHLKWANCF